MARAFSGALERINFGSGVPNLIADWTIAGWFRRRSSGRNTETPLWSRWTNTTTNRQVYIYVLGFSSGANMDKIQVDVPYVANILTGVTQFNVIEWRHFAVTRGGNTWTLYVDGVQEAQVTNATAQETGGEVTLGDTIFQGAGEGDMFGDQAEMGAWNVALTSEEVAELGAAKAAPMLVRPQSLVFYPPLWGQNNPENDLVGGIGGITTGTGPIDHPRIQYSDSEEDQEWASPVATEDPRVITLQGRVDTGFTLQGRDDTRSALQGRDDTRKVLQGSR